MHLVNASLHVEKIREIRREARGFQSNIALVCILVFYTINHATMFFLFRSSHRRCSVRKGVLRNFTKFTGKHLCQSLFFNKVAETLAQVFSCEFCEISKNSFFTEQLWWLLLLIAIIPDIFS